MPAPGELVLMPAICCFKCGTLDAQNVEGFRDRRLAADYFRGLGWRWEKEGHWLCPICSGTKVEQAVMPEPREEEGDWDALR